MKNILSFYPYTPVQESQYRYHGPCPSCGGKDRFAILLDESPDRGGRYVCRKCGMTGDGIQFLREFLGMGFRDAVRELDAVLRPGNAQISFPSRQRQERQKGRPGGEERQAGRRSVARPLPSEDWSRSAEGVVAAAADALPRSAAAKALLSGRGIELSTAVAVGIGWQARDEYQDAAAWGLQAWTDAAGKTHDKVRIPAGLVLPVIRGDRVVSIVIRLADPVRGMRYWQVRGNSDAGLVLPAPAPGPTACVVTESYLDAVLCWQEGLEALTCIALNGVAKDPDPVVADYLTSAPAILLATDADEGGEKARDAWDARYAGDRRLVHLVPDGGKDPCDMTQAHGVRSVSTWLYAGLVVAGEAIGQVSFPSGQASPASLSRSIAVKASNLAQAAS